MYLNRLNNEQKELFIDLCIHASLSNNNFAAEQKGTINAYCKEMNLSDIRYETSKSLDEVLDRIIEISTKDEIRIIILEITALIISDDIYDEREKAFMDRLINKTGISKERLDEILTCLHELTATYKKINNLIFE